MIKHHTLKSAFLMVLLAPPAIADAADEICFNVGTLGSNIMTARQNGVLMSDLMVKIKSTPNGDDPANQDILKMAVSMVIDAYSKPQFDGEEYQTKAISEFQNAAEVQCYKMLGGMQ